LSIEQENRRDLLSLIWTRCCIQSAFAHPIDVVRDADLTLNEKRGHIGLQEDRRALSIGAAQSWLKVKNPKAPAATRAMDGTF
jgi:hypothetical protein